MRRRAAGRALEGIAELLKRGVIDEAGNAIIDPARGLKTVAQGTSTQVWCAVSPDLDGHGGVYCENCEVTGTRLWTLSEKLTGSTPR